MVREIEFAGAASMILKQESKSQVFVGSSPDDCLGRRFNDFADI